MAIELTPFTLIGEDERGVTKSFTAKDYRHFIFLERKAGSLSGNTYHEGKNAGTNPKMFILLSGQIELKHREVTAKEVTSEVIKPHTVIKILPNTVHSIRALTDILILENNSIMDIETDRFREQV